MIPAGWYSDPSDDSRDRFWDGTNWTNNVRARFAASRNDESDYWSEPTVPPEPTTPPPGLAHDVLRPDATTPVPPPPSGRRRRRRWPYVLVVVLVVLGAAGFLGFRYDQYLRQKETAAMLDRIERSEGLMRDWMDDMTLLFEDGERACARTQAACDEFWGDSLLLSGIVDGAREGASSLRRAAGEFTSSRGLRIMSWHKDVVLARDSYLEHNRAWVVWLEAVSRDPGLLFESDEDGDIAATWTAACRNLRGIQESSLFPVMSGSNRARIEQVCADA